MRKFAFVFVALVAVLLVASPAYAQGTAASPARPLTVPIGIGIGMGLAAGLAGLGQGKVAGAVAEALARNPGARPGIQLALFIGLAFIESLVLFTFVLLFIRT
ncbi:MAG TPA: ATP synthase F0 subunit C [Candidatus Angelobacter sp.]|nr:ATP synthase F0 subunit C [Candidatus Angelobacter sp.]